MPKGQVLCQYLNSEALKAFFLTWGKRQGCLLLSIPFYTVLKSLVRTTRQAKVIKVTKIRKEEIKPSLFAHYHLLYYYKTT